ncbi:MAG: DNA mismatch repair protein MutS [Acidobacteria bacterium]|nr:DNA mismatch repair protein MutS [Acidobacteriota bacterium]
MDGLTPAMRQYREIKRDHPDAFLFFRMGDFYEMFYEDAVEGSKILDIALTSRGKDKQGQAIPLCGIPYHALESYLSKMIRTGKKVAICEQVEDPKQAKGVVKREVVRLVTPGTLLEDYLLESSSHNYIASIMPTADKSGLALADISTGEFLVAEMNGRKHLPELQEILSQYSPREIILPDSERTGEFKINHNFNTVISFSETWTFGTEYADGELKKQFNVSHLEGFGLDKDSIAVNAAGALIHYLRETQKNDLPHIKTLRKISRSDYLVIDATTRRNLELIKSLYGEGTTGSLLKTIDHTVTGMGKRMIQSWLLQPLIDKEKIEKRLNSVEELLQKSIERRELIIFLKKISDIERIISRISLRTGNPRDLVALKNSVSQLPALKKAASEAESLLMMEISSSIDCLEDLYKTIDESLNENPPVSLRDGGIIKDGFNEELDSLREISINGKKYISDLELKEKQRTGINNLKVKYNKVFGYYIEISNSNLGKTPDDYIRKQTLVNAERFITPELKEYEAKVLGAEEKINDLEFEIFTNIREQIAQEYYRVQETAIRIGTIDVLCSLAELASAGDYCKPEINTSRNITLKESRHPVVEKLNLDEKFIANNCTLSDEERILIITGPNMGGKSTYLRQVAIIVILSQMGSFVPAKEAKIGIVDRVFTRVGASDSLVQGRSTFLIEMQETAEILNNATSKSLVILDEVGRGTSTFDGLSLAWAVVEYLATADNIKARTLFATHYHELTELALIYPGIKNYSLDVKEWKDQVIFLRKVVEGGSDKSYGIQVAKLAGVPPEVTDRAKEILRTLEEKELDNEGNPVLGRKDTLGLNKFQPVQKSLFDEYLEDPILKELKKIDLNKITPIEALALLEKIQQKIKKKN